MSDETKSCDREYANKVSVGEPELRYAARTTDKAPLIALEVPYLLLKEWHKILSEKTFKVSNGQGIQQEDCFSFRRSDSGSLV